MLGAQPKNYEAAIGLGVALRGNRKIDEAEEQYNGGPEARPARAAPATSISACCTRSTRASDQPNLQKAQEYYRQFLGQATGSTAKRRDAEKRIKDIDENYVALDEAAKMQAEAEEMQTKAEEQQKQMEEEMKMQEQEKQQQAAQQPAAQAAGRRAASGRRRPPGRSRLPPAAATQPPRSRTPPPPRRLRRRRRVRRQGQEPASKRGPRVRWRVEYDQRQTEELCGTSRLSEIRCPVRRPRRPR